MPNKTKENLQEETQDEVDVNNTKIFLSKEDFNYFQALNNELEEIQKRLGSLEIAKAQIIAQYELVSDTLDTFSNQMIQRYELPPNSEFTIDGTTLEIKIQK